MNGFLRQYAGPAIFLIVLLSCVSTRSEETQTPIVMGARLDLFVDHYLIERFEGAQLRLATPTPAEAVLAFDRPWEGRFCGYVTVLKDDALYRMYYRGLPEAKADGSNRECTCYAESADGIHWNKPNLGLFETDDTSENNVVLKGMAPFSHNFAPFLDARPGVAAEERYKAVAGDVKSGLAAFASPDGLHWRKLRDQAILTKGAFDSQNVAFWSEVEGAYVCYLRTWSETTFGGFRSISRATSPDFLTWTDPVEMSFGNTPREHLYTNQTQPYFRAPHLYIATAARFMPGRRILSPDQMKALGGDPDYSGDCSDTVLMTSRGGTTYDRTFMEGFVRPGLGLNNWTSRTNYPARGLVPTGPDEMSLYIQRNYGQTSHHLQRFTLRVDGLASVHAPYAGGEMITKPLTFLGKELVLNYATSAAGGVKVEVQDASGAAVPGYAQSDADEIVGDATERLATWHSRSTLEDLRGQTIRLRFILKDADLYSIRFR